MIPSKLTQEEIGVETNNENIYDIDESDFDKFQGNCNRIYYEYFLFNIPPLFDFVIRDADCHISSAVEIAKTALRIPPWLYRIN